MSKINKNLFGEVATYLQRNMEKEAEAIKEYQEMLNSVTNMQNHHYIFEVYDQGTNTSSPSPTANADKKLLKLTIEQLKEIIAEELKHQHILSVLYETMTGIKAEKSEI